MKDTNLANSNFLTDKMNINLDVFSPLMLNRILAEGEDVTQEVNFGAMLIQLQH
ncbi:hypothetical protein Hanom_Chr09g00788421 [Helianthus anomalus]